VTAEYPLDSLRLAVPLLKEWTYLNTGTVGVMAEPVLAKHIENLAVYERGGHTAQKQAVEGYEISRNALAALLNVDPAHLAFNRNATDGINTVAAAFPLVAGDEVITSSEEHPAMIIPWLAACQRSGASLRYVDVSASPEDFTNNIRNSLNESTRVIALSQVSCETGTRMPVHLLRSLAGPDVAILIDASQSVGQFPVDIPSLNADFVIGNGHKWLAGPKGTGFIWLRPESIHLAPPVYFHSETVDPRWSREHYQQKPAPALSLSMRADRYEFGTRAWHLYGALADAIEYLDNIGWEAIQAHVKSVSGYMKEQLAEIPGVRIISPEAWDDSSGLVTFSIEGWQGEDASARLWNEHAIAQRRVESPSAVRVSATYFTSPDDVRVLASAVDSLARRG
jgi:selenocysteine lyase/cysteine desulfurase